jgi:uncharacterized protein (DUF2384 family)
MARRLAVDRALLLGVLGVSERTLQRKRAHSARLSPAASDSGEKAAQWLKRPSRALAQHAPLQLLDTDAGTQQVERELRQIQHGFVY